MTRQAEIHVIERVECLAAKLYGALSARGASPFNSRRSTVTSPVPRSSPRGLVPKTNARGCSKPSVLNERAVVRSRAARAGSPVRFARSGEAVKALSSSF